MVQDAGRQNMRGKGLALNCSSPGRQHAALTLVSI